MKFKEFLIKKGVSEAEYKDKSVEEMAALQAEFQNELSKALETKIDGVVKSITESIKELPTKEDLSKVEKTSNDNAATLKAIKIGNKDESFTTKLNTFLTEKKDEIKKIHSAGSGIVEFDADISTKAVDTMTTGSATNPDGIPELLGVQTAPPTNVNLRAAWVNEVITTLTTSQSVYTYTDSLPKEGDAAYTAEGTLKPQADMKIETRYAEPKKVAVWSKLTNESVEDIPGLQSIVNDYLVRKLLLKRQNQILFGDGVGANPLGSTAVARSFVAGAMALNVVTPNFMDVVNAAITDIYTTHNFTDEVAYMANMAIVNPVDFFLNLVAAKDNQGLPLYPSASLFNQVTLGGVTIRPERDIPAGKIHVADMSYYNTTNYIPLRVKIGWVNDDFIKNLFVMLVEHRGHYFVKELDKQAFIYDDIATIKAAITKP